MKHTPLLPPISRAYVRAATAQPPLLWDRRLILSHLMFCLTQQENVLRVLSKHNAYPPFNPEFVFRNTRIDHLAHTESHHNTATEDSVKMGMEMIAEFLEKADFVLSNDDFSQGVSPAVRQLARVGMDFYHQFDAPSKSNGIFNARNAQPVLTLQVAAAVLMQVSNNHKGLTGQDSITNDATMAPLDNARRFFEEIFKVYSAYKDPLERSPQEVHGAHMALSGLVAACERFQDGEKFSRTKILDFDLRALGVVRDYIKPYEVRDVERVVPLLRQNAQVHRLPIVKRKPGTELIPV